jgi:hypothetical protein
LRRKSVHWDDERLLLLLLSTCPPPPVFGPPFRRGLRRGFSCFGFTTRERGERFEALLRLDVFTQFVERTVTIISNSDVTGTQRKTTNIDGHAIISHVIDQQTKWVETLDKQTYRKRQSDLKKC